jgi:hypothetical protein
VGERKGTVGRVGVAGVAKKQSVARTGLLFIKLLVPLCRFFGLHAEQKRQNLLPEQSLARSTNQSNEPLCFTEWRLFVLTPLPLPVFEIALVLVRLDHLASTSTGHLDL